MRKYFKNYIYIVKLLKLLWEANYVLTIGSTLARLIRAVLPVGILYVGKLIIDQVVLINNFPQHSHDLVWKLIILELVLTLLSDGLNKIINLMDALLGILFTDHTSIKIIEHASSLDLAQFEDANFYDKLAMARQQTTARTMMLRDIMGMLQDCLGMLSLITALFVFNPWLILFFIGTFFPGFWGETVFNKRFYGQVKGQTAERREMEYLSQLGTSDEGAKEVKLFNLASFILTKYKTLSKKFFGQYKALTSKYCGWAALFAMLSTCGYYIAYAMIVGKTLSGTITIGDMAFLVGLFRQFRGSMEGLLMRFGLISQGMMYLKDFFDFFNFVPEIIAKKNGHPFPKPIKVGFKFENVGFKYANSDVWANRRLNFHWHPGEKLALVGENGAGKTTLIKMIARLYDPTEGRILLDDIDLKEYDVEELRTNMGVIFQDFLRYQMSLSANIAVGNISERENEVSIKSAAKKSLADTLVSKLPSGYEQLLGKRFAGGVELSGGEWQKVALARAYMRDADILVLDEPTAALDARSEYGVFKRFSELTAGKSALLISHRFSTVRLADRILVLDKGELIEIGSHEELLCNSGRYAELFNLQAEGYK